MEQGTIKRLTDKGFGFIVDAGGHDLFFHMSSVEGYMLSCHRRRITM